MNSQERMTFNRRIATGLAEAYSTAHEQHHFSYPEGYVVADEAIIWWPAVDENEFPYGKVLAASGFTQEEVINVEMAMWWKSLPDFRLDEPIRVVADKHGFVLSGYFTGTASDGRIYRYFQSDFGQIDEEGRLTRYEAHCDLAGLEPALRLVTGITGPLSVGAYMEAAAAHAATA